MFIYLRQSSQTLVIVTISEVLVEIQITVYTTPRASVLTGVRPRPKNLHFH